MKIEEEKRFQHRIYFEFAGLVVAVGFDHPHVLFVLCSHLFIFLAIIIIMIGEMTKAGGVDYISGLI